MCNLSSALQPRDSAVLVDGTQFSSTSLTTQGTPAPGLIDAIAGTIMVGNGPSTSFSAITPTVGTISSFGIQDAILFSPSQLATGFINATSSSADLYSIGFIGVDSYGFLFDNTTAPAAQPAAPNSSCGFEYAVQVAAIQGFLQNSKCFIASAAFRSDSAPLRLLRQFRGEFLEQFGAGRSFVHWYYAWSPGAAEWLISNPEFRFPVLLALIPLQILAWLILHPSVLTVLMMTAFGLMGYSIFGNRRKQELRG